MNTHEKNQQPTRGHRSNIQCQTPDLCPDSAGALPSSCSVRPLPPDLEAPPAGLIQIGPLDI